MSPQLVSNRKIRPEGERLACSEHQPFQKKKGEGARSRGEHGQASPWTDMDGHGHGRTDGRPWTAIKINKASAGPLAPKIGILTILMSPITLQLFFMPSDYGVVLLW
jgi:hypothetical protein